MAGWLHISDYKEFNGKNKVEKAYLGNDKTDVMIIKTMNLYMKGID